MRGAMALMALASVGLGSLGGAWAQEAPMRIGELLHGVCQADVATYCPGVQPGGGRMMACFRAHRDQVSLPCKRALLAFRAQRQGMKGREGGEGAPPAGAPQSQYGQPPSGQQPPGPPPADDAAEPPL